MLRWLTLGGGVAFLVLASGCLETLAGAPRCRDNGDCLDQNHCVGGRCEPRPEKRTECGGSVPTSSDACAQCFINSCCQAGAACRNEPECAALTDCLDYCEDDTACADGCRRDHPCGLARWRATLSCEAVACGGSCGERDPTTYPGPRGACTAEECVLSSACGCADGQACHVADVRTGQTACTPAGSGDMNALCTTDQDCASGHGCVEGLCKRYCQDATACAQGICLQATRDLEECRDVPIPGWGYCPQSCLPDRSSAQCPAGTTCAPAAAGADCFRSTGDSRAVNGCSRTELYACAPGYDCLVRHGKTPADCKRWCRAGSGTGCQGGWCVSFSPALVLDGVEFGVCFNDCDPVNPAAACGTGATCEASPEGITDCVGITGTGTGVGDCTFIAPWSCAPGYTCVPSASGDDACRKWCAAGGAPCPAGQQCVLFSNSVVVHGQEYGVCQPR